jgi:hypothetical protein
VFSYPFRLSTKATLLGVALEPGQYELKLQKRLADIYKGKTLLVKAKVKVEPLERDLWRYNVFEFGGILVGPLVGSAPNYAHCRDGIVEEIRLRRKRVIFVELLSATPSGGSAAAKTPQ